MRSCKFIVCAIFFGVVANYVQGQKISISGTVKDSLGNALDVANIVAINQADQKPDGFGITNPDGFYKINIKTNSDYILKVSYLGFQTREIPLETQETDVNLDVTLYEKPQSLEEVEVVYEIPITIQGDTIVYNTDSFVSGTEKKLADVLEKLPGIEVNDDGEIEVEGRRVSKVMVEGEDFFDGDSKIASKNIPANALDKVEVLRNYSEVSQLRGVTNNQDNVALNIKLKEGKKKFWFGEVTDGTGADGRYVAHPKLFYYSPEYSINILTDLNNVGDLPYTARDLRNFTGGLRGATRQNNGTLFNTGSNDLGLSTLQNNRAKEISSRFGALNFSYKPSEAWRFSGFGIYSYNNSLMETNAARTFITTNQQENTITDTDQVSHLGLIKFEANFSPSSNLQWNYDAFFKFSDEEEAVNVLSISDVTDNIVENKKQKPTNLTQNSNLYYTLNKNHIFAMELQYVHTDEDPFYNAIREEQPFLNIIPFNDTQSNFDISQEQRVLTNRVDAKLDYYWVTGPKSNLNFTLGTTQSSQNFNSRIFQILDGGSVLDFNDSELGNSVSYDFSDNFLGVHYKLITGKFTLNPGFTVHNYTATNSQSGTTVKDELFNVVPDLFINLQLKQSESLRLNYNVSRNFSDINRFAQGYVFSDYNSIYQGNRDLESALYHNVSLNFFSFNMFSRQNIFANVSYSKRIDAFKSSTDIGGINQARTTINSNLEDETFNASGNFQRTFGKVKVSARASLNHSNTNNIVNGAPRNSKSWTHSYRGSVGSSFIDAPNLELGYRYSVNNYNTGGTESTFFTDRPFAKFDMAFGKGFIFLADYDYYFYRDKSGTVENKYGFLNASLSYQKKDSKWEYSINATNLTNNQELNNDTFNDLFFRTSAYVVQPRYVVFKIKYDI
ncbi:carboxypeptidase-like regulatory domain-containing protein [Flagellimonas onchidii]|uniref:carboxypeptidase-like regulatory domain-containing protein n=1 Tax=Flagellimonas onchidii TaxID=2562684 RepID=UPI0010A60BA0|nr:carboxypeptidase-like regulatory domain-containing protein [Allomuricauda onchidii]